MFKRVNGENIYSAEFEAHAMRVLGGLDITISMLDDQSVLQAELDHLNMQHVERKIPSEAFDVSIFLSDAPTSRVTLVDRDPPRVTSYLT